MASGRPIVATDVDESWPIKEYSFSIVIKHKIYYRLRLKMQTSANIVARYVKLMKEVIES